MVTLSTDELQAELQRRFESRFRMNWADISRLKKSQSQSIRGKFTPSQETQVAPDAAAEADMSDPEAHTQDLPSIKAELLSDEDTQDDSDSQAEHDQGVLCNVLMQR